MRKVIVSEFVTLDGVMEDPGGAEKFQYGGWTMPYWNDEIGKVKFDEFFASDTLLLGRVTYQGFATAWPSMTDEGCRSVQKASPPGYCSTRSSISKGSSTSIGPRICAKSVQTTSQKKRVAVE